MNSRLRSALRILLLVMVVLLATQLAPTLAARPARATADAAAQRTAEAPRAAKQAAQARTQAEPASPGQAAADQEPTDPQVAERLNSIRRTLEEQALERMNNAGTPGYGLGNFMNDAAPVIVLVVFAIVALWILKVVLENRRWNKMVKVQTETHTKLLDRFGSSQEMLAYMDSEAGRKFLQAPIFEGQRQRAATLPFGRILWSVQIGVVAAFLGAGMLMLSGRVHPEDSMGFTVLGTLVLTLGVGFLVSGGVSYVLAKYFGLLEKPQAELARSDRNA